MKVALVYDRVNKWGGAERTLLALHELFPDAPLYTSVYNSKTAPWADVFNIKTSFLQKFPGAIFSHEYYATLMPIAFESFSFDEFDLVISVTSEAAKGIITKPGTLHICYCLTPIRYLWSGYGEYFKDKTLNFLSYPAISYLRFWDKIAAQRPDYFVAISREVQNRILRYYKRESDIVYPPIGFQDTQDDILSENLGIRQFDSSNNRSSEFSESSGYFLVVSRLVPYKRVDIAIEACNRLKLPLVVIGQGSEEGKLKALAGRNVRVLGTLTDSELVRYYRECRALIFPGIEDFGLTVVEAQSFGKPVIAYGSGGALETIIKGKTGEFFTPQTIEGLMSVLINFKDNKYKVQDCIDQSDNFTKEKFKKHFIDIIENTVKKENKKL